MNRLHLVRHPERHGCRFLREGANRTIFFNPVNRKCSTVPRHREALDFTARKICRDLRVSLP